MKRKTSFILLAGDVVALLLFTLVGQADHNTISSANPLGGWLLLASYFVLPWISAGWLLGAFKGDFEGDHKEGDHKEGDHKGRPYVVLTRALNTWLVAAPLGILLRALAIGEMMIPLPFILAAMTFGGLFLLAWRALFFVVWKSSHRRSLETESTRVT